MRKYKAVAHVTSDVFIIIASPNVKRVLPADVIGIAGLAPSIYYLTDRPMRGYRHIAERGLVRVGAVDYHMKNGRSSLCLTGVIRIFGTAPENLYVRRSNRTDHEWLEQ